MLKCRILKRRSAENLCDDANRIVVERRVRFKVGTDIMHRNIELKLYFSIFEMAQNRTSPRSSKRNRLATCSVMFTYEYINDGHTILKIVGDHRHKDLVANKN